MNDSAIGRAQRAIDLAARERSDVLDLHGLGLKALPPLPAELRTLRRLDLSGNRLPVLPADIRQLRQLEVLDLAANRIATLDPAIGHLVALRSVDLSENRLTSLPAELSACTGLEHLSLFGNQLATLPGTLLELVGLIWLDLARNQLEALPDLRGFTRLRVLDLAANRLSTLPLGLALLEELRVLDLSHNRITSLDTVGLPGSLEELMLDDSPLAEISGPWRATQRLSARATPIAGSDTVLKRTGATPGLRDLRELVSGGYEPGTQYFEAPVHRFGFAVGLRDKEAVGGSLNLYFKAFAGAPVSMRLDDGSRVDLARLGRKSAIDIAAPSASVLLEFPPTAEAAAVEINCEFAERIMQRVPNAVLVETGGQERRAKPVRTERPGFARAEPPAAAEAPGTTVTARLPAAVPAAPRDSPPHEASASGAESVDTAVFCPPRVASHSVFLVQVFLYQPADAAEVEAQALQADETAERRATYSLPLDLPPGTRVDLHLEMPAFTISEPDAVLVWRGSLTAAQFEVGVPAGGAGTPAIGRVRIAIAGVPAGTLRFQVMVTAAGTAPSDADARQLRARRYRQAFVSYSSADRAEVLRRVQAFRIAGLSVFQDVLDLDPGERWERALYHEIDECDVFLLFWSHAAAASEWVGKEIDYALARKHGDEERPPDIQPVPIEGPPIVPPPASLKGLHFNDALLAQIQAADAAAPRGTTGPSGG